MRIHRLVAILLLIESRGRVKAKELAEALETSLRTIHRDIGILCEAGIPLTASTGPNGGISLMDGYTTNLSNIHCDDVVSLFLSGAGIRPHDGTEAGIKLKQALIKLEGTLPPSYAEDLRKAKERFYFDPAPWWHKTEDVPFMDTLRRSVWQSKKIIAEYRKLNGETSSRTIHPYGLVVKSMSWYLAGWCERNKETRIFKCDRFTDVNLTDETFSYPHNFSLQDFWEDSSREFRESRADYEQYPVVIRLPKYYDPMLRDLQVMDRVDENGMITATVNLYKFENAKGDIMDLAGKAEILEPMELRDYVAARIIKLASLYGKER